jgi:hypothetical protein
MMAYPARGMTSSFMRDLAPLQILVADVLGVQRRIAGWLQDHARNAGGLTNSPQPRGI